VTEPDLFGRFRIHPGLLKAVEEIGYTDPTPIQKAAIPLILAGRDVLGQAQTGTGKTAAFSLPMLHRIIGRPGKPAGLVLVPTRELALQVSQEINRMGKNLDLYALAVYGGQPIEPQILALSRGVEVVVGTPGRLIDHLWKGTLSLSGVEIVVIDEADRMLDMGFIREVEDVMEAIQGEHQTLLFSATIPSEVDRIARRYLKAPERVEIVPERPVAFGIEQRFYSVHPQEKVKALSQLLKGINGGQGLIFCGSKIEADRLARRLREMGHPIEALHGDISQPQREKVMRKFRKGEIKLLVATDIAARGIDIEKVTHVFNLGIPRDLQNYIHRIGRTGRAGREGLAITLVSPQEQKQLRQLERIAHSRIELKPLPLETTPRPIRHATSHATR
jgi:ATP-dependent RNA helicase DeaD